MAIPDKDKTIEQLVVAEKQNVIDKFKAKIPPPPAFLMA